MPISCTYYNTSYRKYDKKSKLMIFFHLKVLLNYEWEFIYLFSEQYLRVEYIFRKTKTKSKNTFIKLFSLFSNTLKCYRNAI